MHAGPLVFVAASALFAVTTSVLLRRPLLWLLGVVPDDAFYYLTIARQLVHTGRSTFDGINPANGYHPLWMLVSTACAALVDDKERLLRVVLAVGFVLHWGAALLLAKTLARFTSGSAAWVAAALWLLNPFVQVLLLQGVEAPVFLLALALVVHVYWSRIEPGLQSSVAAIPSRHAVVFGAALGLACLARTEAVIAAAVWIVVVAVVLVKRPGGARATVGFVLTAGAMVLLVCAPWLALSWSMVGSLAQDSGTMKLLWGAEIFRGKLGLRLGWAFFFLVTIWLDQPLAGTFLVRPSGLLAAIVLPPLTLAILVLRRRMGAGGLYRMTMGLGASVVATGLFSGAALSDVQIWHFVQPALALFLLCCGWFYTAALANPATRSPAARRLCTGLLLGLACWLHLHATFAMQGRYPWQRDVYLSQNAFEAMLPAAEPVGAFNAGLPGYFSTRRIINLDGLVNHTVVPYWNRRDFGGYVESTRLRYILDEKDSVDRALTFSRSPLPLTPLRETELTGWHSGRRILWQVGGH